MIINHGNLSKQEMSRLVQTERPKVQESSLTIKFTEGEKTQFFKMDRSQMQKSFQNKYKLSQLEQVIKYDPKKLGGISTKSFLNFCLYIDSGFLEVQSHNIFEYTYCVIEFQCLQLLRDFLENLQYQTLPQISKAHLTFLFIDSLGEFNDSIQKSMTSLLQEYLKVGVQLFYINEIMIDNLTIQDKNFYKFCKFLNKNQFEDRMSITQFCKLTEKNCKDASRRDMCIINLLEQFIDHTSMKSTFVKYLSDEQFSVQYDKLRDNQLSNIKQMQKKSEQLQEQIQISQQEQRNHEYIQKEVLQANLESERRIQTLQHELKFEQDKVERLTTSTQRFQSVVPEKKLQNTQSLIKFSEKPQVEQIQVSKIMYPKNESIIEPNVEFLLGELQGQIIYHEFDHCKSNLYKSYSCEHQNCLECLFSKVLTKQKCVGSDYSTFEIICDIVCLSNIETNCNEKFKPQDYQELFEQFKQE